MKARTRSRHTPYNQPSQPLSVAAALILSLTMSRIASAPEHHLRVVLQAIAQDKKMEAKIQGMLEALQAVDKPVAGTKRKAEDEAKICMFCEEAFNDETNHSRACQSHHPDEYPEGFTWTCCNQLGSEKGCRIHPHKSRQDAPLRRREYTMVEGVKSLIQDTDDE
ncbi:hypothetical protein B0I35DRAFT_445497 [Stachybotrys elegans]|uniref:C2H2-type domain-containing protein n=1 Tax=Stachybotrys elegans TaxID=80388 RepID=A0A8K0SHI0_9HYPO|nr:hypothetical protein B0I35DRAFT_445497 [Stachybotrys elegans]